MSGPLPPFMIPFLKALLCDLAAHLEDQAQKAAEYPEERAAGVPDILHRFAHALELTAGELDE